MVAKGRSLLDSHFDQLMEDAGVDAEHYHKLTEQIYKECEDVLTLQQKTGASFLIGHSFGGLVALEVARNNPSLTKIAVYEPGVSIGGSIPMDWIPGYEKELAESNFSCQIKWFLRNLADQRCGILRN